jgi:hypothetical protein
MSKPSPTGRLSESKPELQELPSTPYRRKFALVSALLTRPEGKSWLVQRLYAERLRLLAEQRQLGQLAIKKAIAAFLASFKR